MGEDAPFSWRRHMAETVGLVGGALSVALLFPAAAEKIFAITGATAVCLVCYVIPVVLHLRLHWLGVPPQPDDAQASPQGWHSSSGRFGVMACRTHRV